MHLRVEHLEEAEALDHRALGLDRVVSSYPRIRGLRDAGYETEGIKYEVTVTDPWGIQSAFDRSGE